MLLSALRRPGAAVLVVSPILLIAAAMPGAGLLALPLLIAGALRSGQGALWAFVAIFAFFSGAGAFAFGRAAWAQQVRCTREVERVRVTTRTEAVEAEAECVQLGVARRRAGLNPPVTLHVVTLSAPGWRTPILLHSGLTSWSANAAARRLSEHLGLRDSRGQPIE
jgi:hypothetical protein